MKGSEQFVKAGSFIAMIATVFALAVNMLKAPSVAPANRWNDNPDKFYLWRTNSSFGYYFTYDPRGADEWLFHHGSRLETNWQ